MNKREEKWYKRYSNEVEKMTERYNRINMQVPTVCRKITDEEIEERNKLKKIRANYPHRLYV